LTQNNGVPAAETTVPPSETRVPEQPDNVAPPPAAAGALRLQVFLAHAGIASRRASERLILEGRVAVNGQTAAVLGAKVLPGDEVSVDGRVLRGETKLHYLAMNKPPEYICSSRDPQGRRLALDLLPKDIQERLYSVGRLDYMSSGLIFFTNDGDFTARLSHPSSMVEKEYLVESTVPVSGEAVDAFLAGLSVDGVWYQAKSIEKLGRRTLKIVLIEGKNREIRRFFSHFHLHPARLQRIRIGPVLLGDLGEGKTRRLAQKELKALGDFSKAAGGRGAPCG
jgi:23S rRNA pseudouridine2605 synthase